MEPPHRLDKIKSIIKSLPRSNTPYILSYVPTSPIMCVFGYINDKNKIIYKYMTHKGTIKELKYSKFNIYHMSELNILAINNNVYNYECKYECKYDHTDLGHCTFGNLTIHYCNSCIDNKDLELPVIEKRYYLSLKLSNYIYELNDLEDLFTKAKMECELDLFMNN